MNRRLIERLLAATALAGVIAIGSGGASAWAPLRRGRPGPIPLVLVLAAAVILGVAGAWVVAFILHRREGNSRSGEEGRTVNARRLLPGVMVAVALIGLAGISLLDLGVAPPEAGGSHSGFGHGQPIFFGDTRNAPVKAHAMESAAPTHSWDLSPVPVAAALLVLLAGGGALWWWWGGGRSVPDGESLAEGIDTEAARGTVLRSIEAMLADPDPNTAVIGAYARLLEGLAAAGVPRRDYEAPVEHLRRALGHLEVRAGPVSRLVDLFEIARFSTELLTAEHRDEAIAALRQLASDLGTGTVGASSATPAAPAGPTP